MNSPYATTWAEHILYDLDRWRMRIAMSFMFLILYGHMNVDD